MPKVVSISLLDSENFTNKEGRAAVNNQQPRVYGRTRRPWTMQQGKADAISGQWTTFLSSTKR